MNIGILGASGSIGKKVISYLSKYEDLTIVCGARNIDELLRNNRNRNINVMNVDIFESEKLKDFIGKIDVLIDCVGPSSKYGTIVATQCFNNNVHYISTSSSHKNYNELKELENCILDKKLFFILSAGIYPGLTELVSEYITQGLEQCSSLDVHVHIDDNISYSACYDMLSNYKDIEKYNNKVIECGKIKKTKKRTNTLIDGIRAKKNRILHYEHILFCKKRNIASSKFYISYADNKFAKKFISAVNEIKLNGCEILDEKVKEIYLGENSHRNKVAIEALVKGVFMNENIERRFQLKTTATNLSALTVAITAICIKNRNVSKFGVDFLHEMINANLFLDELNKENSVQIEVSDVSSI